MKRQSQIMPYRRPLPRCARWTFGLNGEGRVPAPYFVRSVLTHLAEGTGPTREGFAVIGHRHAGGYANRSVVW